MQQPIEQIWNFETALLDQTVGPNQQRAGQAKPKFVSGTQVQHEFI